MAKFRSYITSANWLYTISQCTRAHQDKADGCKGSDEIGTCLLKYFRALPTSISKVGMFSDSCGGQNKNIQIVAVCLNAVNSVNHLKEILHTFLETSHTHLECDSMHSVIEHAD